MVMWNTWPLLEGCIVVKVVAMQNHGEWVGFKNIKVRKIADCWRKVKNSSSISLDDKSYEVISSLNNLRN